MAERVPQTKGSHWLPQPACHDTIWSAVLSCHSTEACLQGPVCRVAVDQVSVLRLFHDFYDFSVNSLLWNLAWCSGRKMLSPAPPDLAWWITSVFTTKGNERTPNLLDMILVPRAQGRKVGNGCVDRRKNWTVKVSRSDPCWAGFNL